MNDPHAQLRRITAALPSLLVGLGLALFASIRMQVFDTEVPNPDISGILYNADGLLRGELPFVDNAEFKPPGSFYLVAASFWALGRDLDALQWFYSGWLLIGLPAVALGVPARAGKIARALALFVYLYYAGMFTYNYTAWMMPVYAWAYAGIVRSLSARSLGWALGAGLASTLAFGIMQRAGVIGAVALVLFLAQARRDGPPWTVLLGWVAGAGLGALLFGVPYLVRGEFGTLLEAMVPLSLVSEYTHRADGGFFAGVVHLPALLAETFAAALALVVAGSVVSWTQRDRDLGPGALFLVASIVGTGLGGGRFYMHYLPQLVPALAVLVGATALGRTMGEASHSPRRRSAAMLGVAAIALGCVYTVATGDGHRYEARARRLGDGKSAAQAAGAHIRARTGPGDTIYGWGWTAWRVYFWADRRAPGRYYKALGRLTTFNSNTEFDAGGDIVFTPGEHATAFITDFDAHPPTYVVISPSFTASFGARRDPLEAFEALRERLQRDYRAEAKYGDLLLLRRVSDGERDL